MPGTDPEAAPDVFLCLRSTLDWADEALVEAGLRADFRPKMDAWNATFDVPYHVFRHRLKQIAELSLSRVEGAVCARLDEVPPGAIVVPVDDDDWLAPDLASELRRRYSPAIAGYHWPPGLLELPRRATLRSRLARWREPRLRCATNNFAVVYAPELRGIVLSHMRATEHFARHRRRIARTSKLLGVQNRNMASQTALAWRQPSITREQLVASYERHRTLYDSLQLPRGLEWATSYVGMMSELMGQIALK